jgi:argininosuccinate lyase
VGDAVRQAVAAGSVELAAFGPPGWLDGIDPAVLDPAGQLDSLGFGGGPGAFGPAFEQSRAAWTSRRDWCADWRAGLDRADRELAAAVRGLAVGRTVSAAGEAQVTG